MSWDQVTGNWNQLKGKIKAQRGHLTDDDLAVINGQRDQLVGKYQQRRGANKGRTKKEVMDDFNNRW